MKRNRKWMAAILLGFALATGTPSASADSSVEPIGQKAFLYMDTNELWLTEDVKAVNLKDGTLVLFDGTGNKKMAMRNIDAVGCGVGFSVREIQVASEDSKRFWEIFATVGAHNKNCGYWLISEEEGKWRFELMVEDLIAVGYEPMEWHLLSSKIEDGQYILESAIEYMPEGARFGYEKKLLTDWNAELIWSEQTRSFLMRQLPLG